MASLGEEVLEQIITFERERERGAKATAQLTLEELVQPLGSEDNSIAIIVKHLHGNMRSRWHNFLTSDGEMPDRRRDQEFEGEFESKESILNLWAEGWKHVFGARRTLARRFAAHGDPSLPTFKRVAG